MSYESSGITSQSSDLVTHAASDMHMENKTRSVSHNIFKTNSGWAEDRKMREKKNHLNLK